MAPSRSTVRRFLAVAVLLSTVGAACTIQPDDEAQPIPLRERGPFGATATGDEAAGTNRIFLQAPTRGEQETQLRSVLRDVPNNAEAILQSLIAGPNSAEREAGLTTLLPEGLELLGARLRARTLTVDVNDVFRELTPDTLRLAVAQIVATADEIDGVENVRLQIDGESQGWPLGDGQNTDRLLTLYDYPGVVESSQPAYPAIPTVNA